MRIHPAPRLVSLFLLVLMIPLVPLPHAKSEPPDSMTLAPHSADHDPSRVATVNSPAPHVLFLPAVRNIRQVRPSGPPVAETNVVQFAAELDQMLTSVTVSFSNDLAASTPATQSSAGTVRTQAGPEVVIPFEGLQIMGVTGSGRADGYRIVRPWPQRYEVSLGFSDFSLDESFYVEGSIDYNFVLDDRVSPPVSYGLFRGTVRLFGAFGGLAEIRGYVANGELVSLLVLSNDVRLLVGETEPPEFLAYVSTIAGTGAAGYQDGAGTQAQFNEPRGITVDEDGRVYVADNGNRVIREIAPDGIVSTLVTGFRNPWDVAVEGRDSLIVSDRVGLHSGDASPLARVTRTGTSKGTVTPIVGEVGASTGCGNFSCDGWTPFAHMPWATGIDVSSGAIYIAQWSLSPSLRMVTPNGFLLTLASGSGHACTGVDQPEDVAKGNRGEFYFISGHTCNTIRVLQPDGQLATLAGKALAYGFQDGTGQDAIFGAPRGLVFDGERYLFVADSGNSLIRRVDTETGEVVRVAGCLAHTPGFQCTNSFGFRDGPGDFAQFSGLGNLVIDRWGDLYVADTRNHAVRLVRIIVDPERRPIVHRFDPVTVQQGQTITMTISGRNLALTQRVDLGAGIGVSVEQAGYRQVIVALNIGPDVITGTRSLTLSTAHGTTTTPDGLSLRVLPANALAQVSTIAGTGLWSPGVNDGPADQSAFAFPTGLHAINSGKLLVADPIEQRIRLVATRSEAAKEVLELMLASSGDYGEILGAVLSGLGKLGSILDRLGIGNFLGEPEDKILELIEQGFDEMCEEAISDCAWIALPWAGIPMAPGASDDFRVMATFFFPTDVAGGDADVFFVADAGNRLVRYVGLRPDKDPAEKKQHVVFSASGYYDRPIGVAGGDDNVVYGSTPAAASVNRRALAESVARDWAGAAGVGCILREGETKHPLGVPMGMAVESFLFIADPYCQTIWRIRDQAGTPEVADLRSELGRETVSLGHCADGPAAFATFGAPMAVAVDKDGDIWVADAGCHSIRVIRDLASGEDYEAIAAEIGTFLQAHAKRLGTATRDKIQAKLTSLDTEFLDANRWWVVTVAGSPDGKAGYQDGPTNQSRFNAPTGIAVYTRSDGQTYVFVSDTMNKRIRLITVP